MIKSKYPECTVSSSEIARLKGLGFLRDKTTEDCFNCRVLTVNGRVTTEFLKNISEAAEKFGSGKVAFTSRLTVEIQGIPYKNIDGFLSFLEKNGLENGGTGPKVRPVVSCKGTTCHYGLIDTFSLSEKIHECFYKGYHDVKLPHKFKIAVGGCPNNCVKPDINDLGIVGQRVPGVIIDYCKGCTACVKLCPVGAFSILDGFAVIDKSICNNCGRCINFCKTGAIAEVSRGYRMYIGGRWGKQASRGIPFSEIFEDEESVLSAIEKTILYYKENGKKGERFADTISRIGFENVEKAIMSDEILKRKDEILADEK